MSKLRKTVLISASVILITMAVLLVLLLRGNDRFDATELISKVRGIISSHVKDYISKIMINGKLSYFMMNAHLFELSGVIKEKLDVIFEEYGIRIQYFNLETIEVPEADYKKVSEAKENGE